MTKQAKRAAQKLIAYKRLFGSEDGQLVLLDLMNHCHILKTSRGKESDDVLFNEGKRDVALYILHQMQANVERLQKFIEQNNKELEQYE